MKRYLLVILILTGLTFAQERYSLSGDIITDSVTGLQWLVGPDDHKTWADAQYWVNSQGGSWRMPTMNELHALYESGIVGGDMGPFTVSGGVVWSKDVEGNQAWAFLFFCDPQLDMLFERTYRYGRAFAVCSDQAAGVEVPVIVDRCGLQWRIGPDQDMSFDEACDWVCNLSMGTEWRSPTRNEMEALYQSGVSLDNWGSFQSSGYRVWTGEVRSSTTAWYLDFNWGVDCFADRGASDGFRAFAVRIPQ